MLEDNIAHSTSETLADAITTKALNNLKPITTKLVATASFVTATNTQQAETTLTLKEVSSHLATLTASLSELSTKLTTNPTPTATAPSSCPTWASVVSSSPPAHLPAYLPTCPTPLLALYDPTTSNQRAQVQQCILHAVCTILVDMNSNDDLAPDNHSPATNNIFREALNKDIAGLKERLLATGYSMKEGDSTPNHDQKTHIHGITFLEHGAYLLKMDSEQAAHQFHTYTCDSNIELLKMRLGHSAKVIPKPHNLIFYFVPCGNALFDPTSAKH
ncbi:hypothetical protein DXG03_006696 [Asterophora parasitica]|uniref:Uncharacterized protein n=1 Tax=Asterophora parasitica TaxID=117018 RepID=A0A9P7KAH9_9AGAR|nr:hypothetical protein DXG03_006696 [Asterophora parasitica]